MAASESPVERLLSAEQREDDAVVVARSQQAEADAERRIREVEQITHAAEAQIEEDRFAKEHPGAPSPPAPPPEPGNEPLVRSLRMTDQQIARRQRRDQELLSELDQTESRIEESRARTEQALNEARQRLEAIESQAGEAEERAARAERLAELRQQEAERERRLHEMLGRINEAERRAREAENRARHAVVEVAKPLDPGSTPPDLLPPEPDPEPIANLTSAPAGASGGDPGEGQHGAPGGVLPGSPADHGEAGDGPSVVPDFENEGASERVGSGAATSESDASVSPAELAPPDAPPLPVADAPPAPAAQPLGDDVAPPPPAGEPAAAAPPPPGSVNLNEASFEQLREAGLSVTQTGRVLAHRERGGGFTSVDELDAIPGFPQDFLDRIKPSLTV